MSTPTAAQVGQGADDLALGLAHAEDQAGLGEEPGLLGPAQDRQAAGVGRGGPYRPLEAGDGLEVVVEHLGTGGEDRRQRRVVALAVRDEDLDGRPRAAPANGLDGGGERACTPVGKVVTGDCRDHGVGQAQARPSPRPPARAPPGRRVGGGGCRRGRSRRPVVQRSPLIMKVAVPSAQHSKMLGQPASSHTVTRSRLRIVCFELPVLRTHDGLRPQPGGLACGQ